jgi:hypothetical protein
LALEVARLGQRVGQGSLREWAGRISESICFGTEALPNCNIVVITGCYNPSQTLFIRTLPIYSGDI